MDPMRFLKPKEFAQRTGLSPKTVQRRLKAGELPAMQPGGPGTSWLIDYEAFMAGFATVATEVPCSPAANSLPECDESQRRDRRATQNIDEEISGPQPAWMRTNFKLKPIRGYGPQQN